MDCAIDHAERAAADTPKSAGKDASTFDVATLSVPDMMCGVCISRIETTLNSLAGVNAARASLSQRRVTIHFDPETTGIAAFITRLHNSGFAAREVRDEHAAQPTGNRYPLLPRVGVAGFAAANIMLLSVSVWSGMASDMDNAMAGLFHWLSALIALPAIAYAGMPFYASAWRALRAGQLNMDVPISLGVLLATAMSFAQTLRGTEHVYFDAAITLLFFLLIGRLLDEQVRQRARSAAENLAGLRPALATVIDADGQTRRCSSYDLTPEMRAIVAAGERVPADGRIVSGVSEIDESAITGETVPRPVGQGDTVHAGTLNGASAIQVIISAAGPDTLIADVSRMMLAAEQSRGTYVRMADRAARIYAPAVHVLGLATFLGWMAVGSGWESALTYAISVLIITCPCALALAVPAVQIAATSRLFKRGVIVKAADGLERLAEIDSVVMDKTGTLTLGTLELTDVDGVATDTLQTAASLAVASRHPYAVAIVDAARAKGLSVARRGAIKEFPGCGLMSDDEDGVVRLGSAAWISGGETGIDRTSLDCVSQLWLSEPNTAPTGFRFNDRLRPDTKAFVASMEASGLTIELLSGDRCDPVRTAAAAAGISHWKAEVKPDAKIAHIQSLTSSGRKVLMIGDGLNDAPALAAAHASISPGTAVDISQATADVVFQGDNLAPIIETVAVARASRRMARQNFALALAYNAVFVPFAVMGHVTPLIAAIAMSSSSILVTLNALRLHGLDLGLGSKSRNQLLPTTAATRMSEATP